MCYKCSGFEKNHEADEIACFYAYRIVYYNLMSMPLFSKLCALSVHSRSAIVKKKVA